MKSSLGCPLSLLSLVLFFATIPILTLSAPATAQITEAGEIANTSPTPFPPADRQQRGPDDPVPPPTDPRHGRGHIGVHFWPGEVEAEAVAGVGAGADLTGERTVAQLEEKEKGEGGEAAAAAADVMEAAEEETDTTFTRSLLGPLAPSGRFNLGTGPIRHPVSQLEV